MSQDMCPGIREACTHWRDAPMLQQTFEALECTLDQDNDACIDCAKAVVESACQIIMTSFHSSQNPLRPVTETPTLSEWLSAAVKALKLGDVRDDKFKKLVSSHHRRSAVLAADAIVAFLHKAYMDAQLDPASSREPWERFGSENALIDAHIGLEVELEDNDSPTLRFLLPGGDELPIKMEISRLLYLVDRGAYVEALNAARSVPVPEPENVEAQEDA